MTRYSINDNWGDTRNAITDCMKGFTGMISAEEAATYLAGTSPDQVYRDYVDCLAAGPNPEDDRPPFTRDELHRWIEEYRQDAVSLR